MKIRHVMRCFRLLACVGIREYDAAYKIRLNDRHPSPPGAADY